MKKKLVLLLLLWVFHGIYLFSQPIYPYVKIDTLNFAQFDKNELVFSQDTSLLMPFFEKFNSVVTSGEGNINIVHIGASHVQAGTFPHRIRKNLLEIFPASVAGRGMIFPYSVARKSNNPADYKVSSSTTFELIRNVYSNLEKPLGVTGIAVYTSDTVAEIRISIPALDPEFITTRIHLFGFADSGRVIPTIRIDSLEYPPVVIDSAARKFIYEVQPFTDTFTLQIRNHTGGAFTITGILLDNGFPGITYHSLGVNGANVGSFLKCDYFVRDMQYLKPDMVIFGLGINDASGDHFDTLEFVNNYLQLVDRIKEVNPECAFVFVTNNDSYKRIARGKYAVNKRGPVVREQFYKLASLTSGAVWDQFEIMGGLKSMDKWRIASLAKTDRVHFTNQGYSLIGDLFTNAFLDAYWRWKLTQIDVPIDMEFMERQSVSD